MTTRRNFTLGAGALAAGVVSAPAVARAQSLKWRMVTSWPKRLPGPGMSAERIATRVRTLSAGKLDIAVYAAGELVPAFEVLDAVGNGVADIGHTAAFYWQGKMPAAAFFTTVPFGLTLCRRREGSRPWHEATNRTSCLGGAARSLRWIKWRSLSRSRRSPR